MDMLHLPFCPILVGVREPPGVASICAASRKLPCLDSPVQEGSGGRGYSGRTVHVPWHFQEGRSRARQSGPCSPGLSGWPRKLALGMQCLAKPGAHIERDEVLAVLLGDGDCAHEAHVCHTVSIEEEDAGLRSVIVADAADGPAGLGDAHIGFRDLRGRDGWPGRLTSAGRIGL